MIVSGIICSVIVLLDLVALKSHRNELSIDVEAPLVEDEPLVNQQEEMDEPEEVLSETVGMRQLLSYSGVLS